MGMIVRGCPADEYQLVNFILTFKGTQMISSGIIASIVAAVKYYLCVHRAQFHTCNMEGPGAVQDIYSALVDFIGSSALVWLAFFWLPCSRNSAGSRDLDGVVSDLEDLTGNHSDYTLSGNDSDANEQSLCASMRRCLCCFYCQCCRHCRCCRRKCDPTRGGRLGGLLCWDMFSFVVCCVLMILLADADVSSEATMLHLGKIDSVEDVNEVIQKDFNRWRF